MPRGVEGIWPDAEQALALGAECAWSVSEVARRLERPEPSTRRWLTRVGVLEQFQANRGTPVKIKPADEQVSELEMLRQECAELRKLHSRDGKDRVKEERVTRALEASIAKVPPPRRVAPAKASPGTKEARHRQLAVLSDFHGGERVDPAVIGGTNAYDWEIMLARVDEVVDGILSHKRHSPTLTGLDIAFGGDMCSGSNHDELAITNEFPLAEQAVRIGTIMGQIVERLVPHYASIRCYSVEGNHPRLTKRPAAKNPHDNGDWIAAVFAAQYLKPHPSVHFTIGRASVQFQLAGRNFYLWHSDGVRSSMPGVPWGGLTRRINSIQAQFPYRIHHFIAAHWHTANVIDGGRLIVNGALKGNDEWCQKALGGSSPPTQLLLTFDEKRQRMTDVRYLTPTAGIPMMAAPVAA